MNADFERLGEWRMRPVAEGDCEALFALHEALFRLEIEAVWGWDDARQWQNFREEWRAHRFEAIECDGQVAGYLQTEHRGDHVRVHSLALAPRRQGQGIGSAVMVALQDRAAGEQREIRLNVFRGNRRSLEFYRRLGFLEDAGDEGQIALRWRSADRGRIGVGGG